jgi:hypothetical protein
MRTSDTIARVRVVAVKRGRTTKHQVRCSICGTVGVEGDDGQVRVSAPRRAPAVDLARFHVDEAHAGAGRLL